MLINTENRVEFSLWESLFCFKRKIEFKAKKIEERDIDWSTCCELRLPGTCIPHVIKAGTYYRVSVKFMILALIFAIIPPPIILLITFPYKPLLGGLLVAIYVFLYILVLKIVCDRKFEKIFYFVRRGNKKVKVIYPENSKYDKIVIGF